MAQFDELKILQQAEGIADDVWGIVIALPVFQRDVVGGQLCRAADSIGANIAESFGRYSYGEKLQFLYYARGSLFETKYWVNRIAKRQLVSNEIAMNYGERLTQLAKQMNSFASGWKSLKNSSPKNTRTLREESEEYIANPITHDDLLFTDIQIGWLNQLSTDVDRLLVWNVRVTESPIPNP